MTFLVAIDGVPDLDDDLLDRLARATRKGEGEWKKALVAPSLPRVVLSARTESDARLIMDRLTSCGLVAHCLEQDDVVNAMESAFEATWAEPGRDGVLFIAADGRDLHVNSSSIRLLVTGHQLAGGERKYFCVLGLKSDPGAIIVRIPGAELSEIVKHAEEPPDVLEAFIGFVQQRAPHVLVERGLERHAGRLSGLDEVGTTDLANAGVLAMWLLRTFPPKARAARPAPSLAAMDAPFHADPNAPPPGPAPLPSIDVAVDHRRAQRDLHNALPDEVHAQDLPIPQRQPQQERVSWRDTIRTPEQQQRRKRLQLAAGGAAIIVAAAIAFAVLHRPEAAVHRLQLHETWASPYGVTFTFNENYDAGFGDVHDPGFVIAVEKGSDKRAIRLSGHDSKDGALRDALGVKFRVTSFDDAGGGKSSWIAVEAKRP